MLNVDKNYCNSAYIDSYWKNNLIIDSNLTKINTNLHIENKLYEIEKELDINTYKNKEYTLSTKPRWQEYNL